LRTVRSKEVNLIMADFLPDNHEYFFDPLACRRCGAISTPTVSPGTGPHAYRANCPECGAFMKWLSTLTPEEQEARRAAGRWQAMATKPPTEPQLRYLRDLSDVGPPPANRAEASSRIDALKRKGGAA